MSDLNLSLQRQVIVTTFTMGELRTGDRHLCWTLEDPIREHIGVDGYYWRPEFKLPKATAIPSGRYEVVVSFSGRFKRPLPMILRVPDFTAIRMHGGNSTGDTEGCPLLGLERAIESARIWNCAPAVDAVTSLILEGTRYGKVWVEITNP